MLQRSAVKMMKEQVSDHDWVVIPFPKIENVSFKPWRAMRPHSWATAEIQPRQCHPKQTYGPAQFTSASTNFQNTIIGPDTFSHDSSKPCCTSQQTINDTQITPLTRGGAGTLRQ